MSNLTPQLTNTGIDMMTAALNGDGIIFTKICLGDGTSADQTAMTALDSQRMEVVLTEITRQGNYVLLTCSYNNSNLGSGFYAKELGVYAKSTNNNTERLYAYRYSASNVDYIPAISSGRVVDTELSIMVSVGTAEEISAIIAEGSGYASEATVNSHINNTNNPHHVTKAQLGLENVVNSAPDNMEITAELGEELEAVSSGDTLSAIAGKIRTAIEFLRAHMMSRNNPHSVTLNQIGAAAANHTHSVSTISGTLPVNKGGTGVSTQEALAELIRQYVGAGGGFSPFTMTLGNAVLSVNGSDINVSLSDMGISEAQYDEMVNLITWQNGYAINVQSGELEETSSRNIYYARVDVAPGEDWRLRGWFAYNTAAYCVYDTNDTPLTWDVGHAIPYVTRDMYTTLDFTIPPGGAYMIVCNYNSRTGRNINEYSLSVR